MKLKKYQIKNRLNDMIELKILIVIVMKYVE